MIRNGPATAIAWLCGVALPGSAWAADPSQPAAPAIVVHAIMPPSGALQTWLPVGLSVLSALVALMSLRATFTNLHVGFRRDAAAIARELRARQTGILMQAYENNVGHPVGMALDTIERMVADVARLKPVVGGSAQVAGESGRRSVALYRAYGSAVRLCAEADGALFGAERQVFQRLLSRQEPDDALIAAAHEALAPPADGQRPAYDAMLEAVTRAKLDLRRALESERVAELQRSAGDVRRDPFYPELRRWLDPDEIARLLDPDTGAKAAAPPAAPWWVRLDRANG